MRCLRWAEGMAGMTGEDFVTKKLIGEVGAAGVVTGEDFTFGKGRSGNVQRLAELGTRYSLRTEAVAPVMGNGKAISSSRIREALQTGYCAEATRLLTRPFAIEGGVSRKSTRLNSSI